jgi:hypothetical protein
MRGPTQRIVGLEHRVKSRLLQQHLLIWRRREMARHLMHRVHHRRIAVGMTHLHLVRQQLFVGLVVAVDLLQRDAERHGLDRHPHRRQRDAIVRREILDRLDLRIARDELERQPADAGDALHVSVGLAPQQQHVGDAAGHDIHAAGEQRIGRGTAARQRHPRRLEVFQSSRCRMLLDELSLLHQNCRREQRPWLFRYSKLGYFSLRWQHRQAQRPQCGQQSYAAGHSFLLLCFHLPAPVVDGALLRKLGGFAGSAQATLRCTTGKARRDSRPRIGICFHVKRRAHGGDNAG